MPFLETVDLCQRFGQRDILKNINLSAERGEVFALIGPTGAGKTTLLRLLDLLDLPASGKIYWDGRDTSQLGKDRLEVRRKIAFVLQKPAVFDTSVYNNIAYGLRWRGARESSVREIVSSILEMVGLSSYKNRNARTLSGGEVQRVALARAIAIEPELLLLDEPTANLDPVLTAQVEELIANIINQYATTIIMATHDLAQGQRLADRVGVLSNGEILQAGDWRQVFNSPRNREVADFVGVENTIDGVVVSNENRVMAIDVGGKVITAISDYSVGEAVCACIRPEDITLSLSRASSSARNTFGGEITRVVSMAPLTRVKIDCGFPLVCLITNLSAEELDFKKGKHVYAAFKATGVHVIKR